MATKDVLIFVVLYFGYAVAKVSAKQYSANDKIDDEKIDSRQTKNALSDFPIREMMANQSTLYPPGPFLTNPDKRHIHFKQLGLASKLRSEYDNYETDLSSLEYLNYDGHLEDIPYDYSTGGAITTKVDNHVLNVENCTKQDLGTGLMGLCCMVREANFSESSKVCWNETYEPALCPELKWEPYLKLICVPILCVFGFIGNTVSFLVMCSGAYRRKSYGYYLRALAVFDNLTLIISLLFALNDATFDMSKNSESNSTYSGLFTHHTTASCKITEFMRHVVYLMSSWLVVCFTVDRFIAVCFPLLRVRYCTDKSAKYTIAFVLAAIMLSQSYHLVFIERLDRLQNPHVPCHAPVEPDKSIRLTYLGLNYFWYSLLLRFAFPFLAVAICNGCVIYHIERMKTGRHHSESRRKQKANLAIYTLYAVCACFIITLLPNAIITIIQYVEFMRHDQVKQQLYCTLQVVYTPFHIIRMVNYAANCVLYGLTGQQFRRELKKLLRCCFHNYSITKRSIQTPEPIPLTSRKNWKHQIPKRSIENPEPVPLTGRNNGHWKHQII